MTIVELGKKLNEMYESAKRNEAVCQIHLFGIMYGNLIRENGYHLKDIIKASKLSAGYLAELSKGVKLAKHVVIKQDNER